MTSVQYYFGTSICLLSDTLADKLADPLFVKQRRDAAVFIPAITESVANCAVLGFDVETNVRHGKSE